MQSATNPSSKLLANDANQTASPREFVSDSIAVGLVFALALTIGQRIVGFGRGILFCRLMTDQELGQWSMIWSYLMLLAPLAVLGLPGCFGKYSEYYRNRGQLKTFVKRVAGISLLLTCALSTTLFLLPETFAWFLFRDSTKVPLVRLIAIALIFVAASNFLTTLLESLRQVRAVTLVRFLTGIGFAAASVGLLWVTPWGAFATTIGFTLGCVLGILPAIWILWKYRDAMENRGERLTHKSMWKRIAPFAIWLWVSNLLNNLFEVSDRYMLIHWSSLPSDLAQGSVGQYHSGRVVPLLMVSVASMLAAVLLPYMSEAWEAGQKRKAARQLNWTIKSISLSFTAGGLLILMLAPLLFDWILQGRYDDGLAVLPLTLVYCIWFSLHTLGQDYLWVAEKGKWATAATAFGLVLNILLNLALIPWLGLAGAVTATAIGNLFVVLAMFALNQRFGASTDAGIWSSAAIPLVLMLGTTAGAFVLAGLLVIAVWTDWIFSAQEKTELTGVIRAKLGRRR